FLQLSLADFVRKRAMHMSRTPVILERICQVHQRLFGQRIDVRIGPTGFENEPEVARAHLIWTEAVIANSTHSGWRLQMKDGRQPLRHVRVPNVRFTGNSTKEI